MLHRQFVKKVPFISKNYRSCVTAEVPRYLTIVQNNLKFRKAKYQKSFFKQMEDPNKIQHLISGLKEREIILTPELKTKAIEKLSTVSIEAAIETLLTLPQPNSKMFEAIFKEIHKNQRKKENLYEQLLVHMRENRLIATDEILKIFSRYYFKKTNDIEATKRFLLNNYHPYKSEDVIFEKLFKYYEENLLVEKMEELIYEIHDADIKFTFKSYSTLIRIYISIGKISEGVYLFDRVRCSINEVQLTYKDFLFILDLVSIHGKNHELLNRIQQIKKRFPNEIISKYELIYFIRSPQNSEISFKEKLEFLKNLTPEPNPSNLPAKFNVPFSTVEEGEQVYNELIRLNIIPSVQFYKDIIPICKQNGDFEKAKKFISLYFHFLPKDELLSELIESLYHLLYFQNFNVKFIAEILYNDVEITFNDKSVQFYFFIFRDHLQLAKDFYNEYFIVLHKTRPSVNSSFALFSLHVSSGLKRKEIFYYWTKINQRKFKFTANHYESLFRREKGGYYNGRVFWPADLLDRSVIAFLDAGKLMLALEICSQYTCSISVLRTLCDSLIQNGMIWQAEKIYKQFPELNLNNKIAKK